MLEKKDFDKLLSKVQVKVIIELECFFSIWFEQHIVTFRMFCLKRSNDGEQKFKGLLRKLPLRPPSSLRTYKR